MSDKVVSISDHSKADARHVSPEKVLADTLKDIKEDPEYGKYNKCFVVLLGDGDERYDTAYKNAQMSGSEILALLEIVKSTVKREMGY